LVSFEEATIPFPKEAPNYEKSMPILHSMGFKVIEVLGKHDQGMIEPIILEEWPNNLGLGDDHDALH
jgi:hypothetical protein